MIRLYYGLKSFAELDRNQRRCLIESTLPITNSGCNINPVASQILRQYQEQVTEFVPEFLDSVYIYGSVALQDYIPDKSDIDFIAISPQRASPQQYRKLALVHHNLKRMLPTSNLSGMYVCWDDLGKQKTETLPYPFCTNNRMHRSGHFELNEVTWWQLKHKSIRAFGEKSRNFDFGIHVNRLKQSVTLNMCNYWKPWLEARSKTTSYRRWLLACFPGLVEWGALTISRQYFTLITGDVTSKTNAGRYCLKKFPIRFERFLNEVIDMRNNGSSKSFSVDWRLSQAAIDYMRFVISECDRRDVFTS